MERLRQQQNALVVPGEHFLMGNYLRIGYGCKPDYLRGALERVESFLSELR